MLLYYVAISNIGTIDIALLHWSLATSTKMPRVQLLPQGSEPPETESTELSPKHDKQNPRRTSSTSTTWWSFVRYPIYILILAAVMGNFLVESPVWGYEKQIHRYYRQWVPRTLIEFTPVQLAQYDGTNPDKPLYVAVKGQVFDVSKGGGRMYGPGGAYHCL